MEQNKESNGLLVKLAMISEAVQEVHSGKGTIIYELERDEFNHIKNDLNIKDEGTSFKLDISGTEIIYMLNEGE